MRALIISDTHGSLRHFKRVVEKCGPFDYLIHCGDVEGDEAAIMKAVDCLCTFVRGNNDFACDLEDFEVAHVAGRRYLVTHGHRAGIAYSAVKAREAARQAGCCGVIYGHTHLPFVDITDPDVAVMNPGSLTYPRQLGRKPSFIIMETDTKGGIHYMLNYLER